MEGADPSESEGRYENQGLVDHRHPLTPVSSRFRARSKLYRSAGEGDWLDQPTGTVGVTEDLFNDFLFYGVKAKETLHIAGRGEVLVGVDWDYTEGDYTQEFSDGSTDAWDGDHFDILSPYLAMNWRLGPEDGLNCTPSVGARYYEHSNSTASGPLTPGCWSPMGRPNCIWVTPAGWSIRGLRCR